MEEDKKSFFLNTTAEINCDKFEDDNQMKEKIYEAIFNTGADKQCNFQQSSYGRWIIKGDIHKLLAVLNHLERESSKLHQGKYVKNNTTPVPGNKEGLFAVGIQNLKLEDHTADARDAFNTSLSKDEDIGPRWRLTSSSKMDTRHKISQAPSVPVEELDMSSQQRKAVGSNDRFKKLLKLPHESQMPHFDTKAKECQQQQFSIKVANKSTHESQLSLEKDGAKEFQTRQEPDRNQVWLQRSHSQKLNFDAKYQPFQRSQSQRWNHRNRSKDHQPQKSISEELDIATYENRILARSRQTLNDRPNNLVFKQILPKTRTEISIYCQDITSLDVDCVVNAANEMLEHVGGVAEAIAEKAGPELIKECDSCIRKNGRLRVGEVFATTGGNMCKYVIHAVGPAWWDYEGNISTCMKLLRQAFFNSFEKAVKLNVSTVAVPAISSGVFAVPHETVVDVLWNAIMEYDNKTQRGIALKEIHLVNITPDITKAIMEAFTKRR